MGLFSVEYMPGHDDTSLQGHIIASYPELLAAFGEPTDVDDDLDVKVTHEWLLVFDHEGEWVYATVYDWKEYDGGEAVRSNRPMTFNIGGTSPLAVRLVRAELAAARHQMNRRS